MATYDRDYELWGIALPDELLGMFDTRDVLRVVRRYGIVIVLLLALAGVAWVIQYERAEREQSERYAPIQIAQAEVTYLQEHHGTEEDICAAQRKLAQAENEARLGDGNDVDHLLARSCALNLELKRRLDTGY